MNKRQIKKFNMYAVVRDLVQTTESAIIDLMPKMSDYLGDLKDYISAISADGVTQITNRKGVTEDKDELKIDLLTKATDVARKVKSYAADIKDYELLNKVNYSYTTLDRLSGAIIVLVCDDIYDKAKAHLADLATYGVTDPNLVSLRKAIDDFNVLNPAPRTGIVSSHIATLNLIQLFAQADVLLDDQMDVAVGIVKDSHPTFYDSYFVSRKLVKPSSHPLAIRCEVVDVAGLPIAGVTALFAQNGMIFKTKAKGQFYVHNFPTGTFKATFARPGYVTQEVRIIVASGQRTDVKVVMITV